MFSSVQVPQGIVKDKAGRATAVRGEVLLGTWKLLVLWSGPVPYTCRGVWRGKETDTTRRLSYLQEFLFHRGKQDKREYQIEARMLEGGLTRANLFDCEDSCPRQKRIAAGCWENSLLFRGALRVCRPQISMLGC